MPWVRLDEDFPRHPKIAAAGPLGLAMQVAALCYCNQYLTDGFIPSSVAETLLNLNGLGMGMWSGEMVGGGEDACADLVIHDVLAAGLWHVVDGGYVIHDYHKYQPSKADVLADRKQKSEAGRLGGLNSAKSRTAKTSRREAPAKAHAVAPAQAESKPVPVPGSVPINKTKAFDLDVENGGTDERGRIRDAGEDPNGLNGSTGEDHGSVIHLDRAQPDGPLAAEVSKVRSLIQEQFGA